MRAYRVTLTVEMSKAAYQALCDAETDAESCTGPTMPMWRAGKAFTRKLSRITRSKVRLLEWTYTGVRQS